MKQAPQPPTFTRADPEQIMPWIDELEGAAATDFPARRDEIAAMMAEGWAWLKYDDDGQEFEADLGTVQLVALLEG